MEIILRIIGYFHFKIANSDWLVKNSDDSYVILCLGDSFTFGVGAPNDKSYPKQLEELLNDNNKGKKFKVINAGVGGYNTSMILDKFVNDFKKIKPDLVVALIGGANVWNAKGYTGYSKKQKVFPEIQNFFYSIKIFKLIKLLSTNIKDKTSESKSRIAINEYKKQPINMSEKAMWYDKKATDCELEGKYDEAIEWLNKSIQEDPDAPLHYFLLGKMYNAQNNFKKAAECFKKAIELNFQFGIPPPSTLYASFTQVVLQHHENIEDAVRFLSKYENAFPEAKEHKGRLLLKEKYFQILEPWVISDVKKMINICQGQDIKIILQNYPNINMVNSCLKKLAIENSIPFVDNEQIFRELLIKGEKKESMFQPDRHCNARGYGIITKNIYDKMVEYNIFNMKEIYRN